MPDTFLNTLHTWTYFILTTIRWCKFYYSQLNDVETEEYSSLTMTKVTKLILESGCKHKNSNSTKELEKLIELPCDPVVPLLELKTGSQRDICTLVFIATLFTITKIWKQPKCPLMDEWIKKMWDKETEIHHRLALDLGQTQQRKGYHLGLLLSRTMDAYIGSA